MADNHLQHNRVMQAKCSELCKATMALSCATGTVGGPGQTWRRTVKSELQMIGEIYGERPSVTERPFASIFPPLGGSQDQVVSSTVIRGSIL